MTKYKHTETKSGPSTIPFAKKGYKKTKLGWIPENWNISTVGNYLEFIGGNAFKSDNSTEKGVRWLKIANVGIQKIIWEDESYLPSDFSMKFEKYLLYEGDVVMALTRPILNNRLKIARLNRTDSGALLNQRVGKLLPKENSSLSYFYYLFQTNYVVHRMEVAMAGTDPPNIGFSDLRKIKMPLPPLSEQKKIAEILSTWDQAIETLEQLIAKKEELKRGLMQELLIPNGFDRWIEVKLGKLGEFSKGKGVSKSEVTDTGIPAVRYGELYTVHHVIIKEFTSHINRESAEQSKRIQKGDILFAGSGETAKEIGKCAVFTKEFEAYAGGDIVILRPKNVNPVYLSYYLNSAAAIKQKSKLGQGHSVVHIYSRDIKQINVFLPDIERQMKIVKIFAALESEIQSLKDLKMMTEIQKKGLMQQLLTGKTRAHGS